MEKLTCILAVVDHVDRDMVVLDKAVALARRYGARVDLMVPEHVPMRPLANRCAGLEYDRVILSSVACGSVPLNEIIARHAFATKPDLVIKFRDAGDLTQASISSADWQLASESPAPLLLVHQTPWSIPTRFATVIEVDDASAERLTRAILHAAGYLALGCRGNLDVLYSERERNDERLRMERAVKVAQLVREFHVGCERIEMFSGAPEERLPPIAAQRQYDVLVLGMPDVYSGPVAHDSLIGGMTSRVDSDLVLVRAINSMAEHTGERARLLHQQRPDHVEQFV